MENDNNNQVAGWQNEHAGKTILPEELSQVERF